MKYIISYKVNGTSRVRLLIRRRSDDKLGDNKREQMRGRVGDGVGALKDWRGFSNVHLLSLCCPGT